MPDLEVPQLRGDWEYDLTGAISENKQVYRSGVKPPLHPEVVGVDGRLRGGLRLHQGFKTVRTLGQALYDESDNTDAGASLGQTGGTPFDFFPIHSQKPNLHEFYPFKVRVGADSELRGFVYKVKAISNSAWYIEYFDPLGTVEEQYNIAVPKTGVWKTQRLFGFINDVFDKSWSVVTRGRLLYLYVKGQAPTRWFIDTTTTGKFHILKTQNTGPGPRPTAPTVTLDFKSWPKLYNGGNFRHWLEFPYQAVTANFVEENVENFDEQDVLEPGWYTFAYQLLDSKTGLKSQLSEYFTLEKHQFVERVPYRTQRIFNGTNYENESVMRSTGTPQKPTLVTPDIDTLKWDTCLVYRSLRVGAPGGEIASQILYLDKRIDLNQRWPDSSSSGSSTSTDDDGLWNPGSPVSGGSAPDTVIVTYAAFLKDMALAIQKVYRNKDIFLETPPKGGVAFEYRGTIFVSDIEDTDITENLNVGEIRFSSLTEESPELFPPDFRFLPTNAFDEVITSVLAGDTMLAFSDDRQFDITLSGGFVVFREQHEAYGAVSRFATASYGSSGFVVTRQGLKELQVNGQMLAVQHLNKLFMEDWKMDWSMISSSADSPLGCIMHLNPNESQIACQWWETRQLSELHHAPFRHTATGYIPNSTDDTKRALFMSPAGRIVAGDVLREKVVTLCVNEDRNGSFFSGYLDIAGDHTLVTASVQPLAADELAVEGTPSDDESSGSVSFGPLTDSDWRDAWVYVASGLAEGTWFEISYGEAPSGDERILHIKGTVPANIADIKAAGTRLVLDPMPFDMTLWKFGSSPAKQGSKDPGLFTLRNISTMGLLFEDVLGAGLDEPEATFYFSVRKGNLDSVTERSKPDMAALVAGPQDFGYYANVGEGLTVKGQSLYPRVEVIAPDVDFILTGAIVGGIIDTTTKGL